MEVRLGKRYFGGFGDEPIKTFRRNTQIKFFTEEIGFLTMCGISQADGELYRTSDGGKSFTKVNIIEDEGNKITVDYGNTKKEILESEIFDFYELPEEKDEKLYLKINKQK